MRTITLTDAQVCLVRDALQAAGDYIGDIINGGSLDTITDEAIGQQICAALRQLPQAGDE